MAVRSPRPLVAVLASIACWVAAGCAHADLAPTPCADAAHRALDFWLGEWDVHSDGDVVAHSRIERSPFACAIVETYRQKDGFTGTSLSFYDTVLKRWRQTWVDSTGSVGEFTGEATRGRMQFTGATHRADGSRIQRRMTLAAEGANVRQTSLAARERAPWQPHYELVYTPRRSKP